VLIEGDHLVFTRQLNSKGNSALHEAALEGVTDVNILSKLIANDLLVLKNLSGDTALLLAVDKSNTHLIPNLLNMPSLLHVRDSEDRTPFHRCRDPEVLGLLLDGLNRSRHRSSLTHVERNSHEASSLVDVNSRDIYGKTALYMACAQGNLKMMREFINAGADVNIADKTERCPILAFSTCIPSASKDRMILRLRVKGADPDREDIDGNTARKELQRLSSTKTVNKLLSLDPAVELERLETRSRAERRESNATSSTTRSNISFAGLFS
jgi:ankyrin repeat protein